MKRRFPKGRGILLAAPLLLSLVMISSAAPTAAADGYPARVPDQTGAEKRQNAEANRRIFRFLQSMHQASDINRRGFEAQLKLSPVRTSTLKGKKVLTYVYGADGDWGYLFTLKDGIVKTVAVAISRTVDSEKKPVESCALDLDSFASEMRALKYAAQNASVHGLGGERINYSKNDIRIRMVYTTTRAPSLSCVNVIEIEPSETENG